MMSMWLLLLCSSFVSINAQSLFSISYQKTGCLNDACTQLCDLGVQDCSSSIPICEFGYFLFNKTDCVLCPQQNLGLIFYCMDCVENPTSWNSIRQCSYDYYVFNGNFQTGTYIRKERTTTNLYYVQLSQTQSSAVSNRNMNVKYQVNECIGCLSFCSIQSEECNLLTNLNQVDTVVGVICNDGYYFNENVCKLCPQHCDSCFDAQVCYTCRIGFALNSDSVCQQCFTNCLDCVFMDNQMSCLKCDKSIQFFIKSLDFATCIECEQGCKRCEYIQYISQGQLLYSTRDNIQVTNEAEQKLYIQRCRQCAKANEFISADGINCIPCRIQNCLVCYQLVKDDTTLSMDFIPIASNSGQVLCQIYRILVSVGNACIAIIDPNCLTKDKLGNCIRCANNYILDIQTYTCSTISTCSQQIPFCLNCYSYLDSQTDSVYDKNGNLIPNSNLLTYQCIECQPYYYADFFTGSCLPCTSSCLKCSQYSQSFNFTQNLIQQINPMLTPQKLQFNNEPLSNECIQCNQGYLIYGQTCLGCENSCQINAISQCEYLQSFAYCSQCQNPLIQQSVTSDLSQCQQCPNFCLTCRSRISSDYQNQFFNPINTQLVKYSNVCYSLQANVNPLNNVYIDTQDFFPVVCIYPKTAQKCRVSTTLNLYLYCDDDLYSSDSTSATATQLKSMYKLSSMFRQQDQGVIQFNNIETYSNYDDLNKNSVRVLNLIINLKGSICQFPKPTVFSLYIPQNVFSLQNMTVTFTSAQPITFYQYGSLSFNNISSISFQNIIFEYYSLRQKAKIPLNQFGLNISGFQSSTYLKQVSLNPNNPKTNIYFQLNIQNCLSLSIQDTKLYQTNSFLNITQTTQLYSYTLFIQNSILMSINLYNTSLFQLDLGSTNNITINNLQVNQSRLHTAALFKSKNINLVNLNVNGFQLLYTQVNNSRIIDAATINTCLLQNIDIYRTYVNYSVIIYSNNLQINNLFVSKSYIYNQSIIISKYDNKLNILTMKYSFRNVNISENYCDSPNCLFRIFQSSQVTTKPEILLQNIQIYEIDASLSPTDEQYITSALIYFQYFGAITIQNLKSDFNLGVTVFYFSFINSINADTVICDWSNPQIQKVEDYFIPASSPNITSPMLSSSNNKIPYNQDCLNNQVEQGSYNSYCIYIDSFVEGVYMNNILIRSLLNIDSSVISINSYDSLILNTSELNYNPVNPLYQGSEYVIIQNSNFLNNSFILNDQGSQLAIIEIQSQQVQIIKLINLNFQSNHLQLVNSQIYPSATCLLIQSEQATISLNNSNFQYNRAVNIDKGIIYIIAEFISYYNSTFTNTNDISIDWINRFSDNQLKNYTQFLAYIPIFSNGANSKLFGVSITITSCIFNISSGINGNSLYITTSQTGIVDINQSQFIKQNSNLVVDYQSSGGCIYIDSSSANISLQIQNTIFNECVSRSFGGAIYIDTSKNQQSLQFYNLTVSQCSALQGSILYAAFTGQNNVIPYISIDGLVCSDNNFKGFISLLDKLTDIEKQILLTTASVIYLDNAQVSVINSHFSNILHQSIFQILNSVRITLVNNQFISNQLTYKPLISTSLELINSSILIESVAFQFNQEYLIISQVQDCTPLYYQSLLRSLTIQTCNMLMETQMIESLQDQSEIDSNYLYTDQLDEQFIEIQNKYNWVSPNYQSVMYQPYTVFQMQIGTKNTGLLDCILSSIFQNEKIPSLVSISSLQNGNLAYLSQLVVSNNTCNSCQNGLINIVDFDTQSFMQVIDSQFVNNLMGYYGCLTMSSQSSVNNITTNQDLYQTLNRRMLSEQIVYNLNIQNCKFISNIASVGSCLSIININTFINNSQFSNNIARYVGGSIYFNNLLNSTINQQNLIIQDNTAQVGGGVYLQNAQFQNMLNMTISNNNGTISSSNIYDQTRRITLSMKLGQLFEVNESDQQIKSSKELVQESLLINYQFQNSNNFTFLMLPSGQSISQYKYTYVYTQEQVPYEWVFRIINLNEQGDILVNQNSSSSCAITGRVQNINIYDETIQFLTNYTSINTAFFNISKGGYDLDNLKVIFDPLNLDSYLELSVQCKDIKISFIDPSDNSLKYNDNYQLLIPIKTLPCQLGEVYYQQQCLPCRAGSGTYSVNPNSGICQTMDQTAMVEVTPFGINLQAGYWRPSYDNSQHTSCTNLIENCQGGWVPGDPSCYPGHRGALCESCDIYAQYNSQSYSNTQNYVCGPCQGNLSQNIGIFLGTTIATLISIALAVKGTYDTVQSYFIAQSLTLMGVRIRPDANNLGNLIKILTNYFQIIQIITTFQLQIPQGITTGAQAVGNPTQSSSFSLDCLLVQITDIDILYFRMIWAFCMPFFYLAAFLIQYILGVLAGKIPFKTALIYTAFIYMFIFQQPTLVQGFMSLISSRYISGVEWVQSDVAYQYSTTTHLTWVVIFGVPLLLLLVVIFPSLFYYKIWKYRFNLNNRIIRQRYGFFYNEYTKQAYYWEFIKMLQKEVMIVFLVYYRDQIVIKGILIFFVLYFYVYLSIEVQPYESKKLTTADRTSMFACSLTILMAVGVYQSQLKNFNYLIIIFFFIMALINLLYYFYIGWLIFEGYLYKFQEQVDQGREIINSKFPQLKQHKSLRKFLNNRTLMDRRIKDLWSVLIKYTKENIQLRRQGQPNFELLINSKFDFEAARQYGKDQEAAIIPISDNGFGFLNSNSLKSAAQQFESLLKKGKNVSEAIPDLTKINGEQEQVYKGSGNDEQDNLISEQNQQDFKLKNIQSTP